MKSMVTVLKGNLLILTIGNVIRQLSLFVTFPYFSLYIKALGGSNIIVGSVTALRPLASMLLYPFAGNLADNYGRVKIIVIGGYLNAALYLIYMLAPNWQILAIANFFNGFSIFIFPATSALLADSMPSHLRGRGFAALTTIPGFIGILSPYIGGYLITVFGVEKAMRFLYGITVVGLSSISTLNMKLLKETLTKSDNFHPKLEQILYDSYRKMWSTIKWMPKEIQYYTIILIFGLFFNSLVQPYWVIYVTSIIRLSKIEWGSILLIANIIGMFISIPLGFLIDKYNKKKIVAIVFAFSAFPMFLFPYSNDFCFTLLVIILISIVNAFLTPATSALMADMIPKERRATVMAALGRGGFFVNLRGGGGGGPNMGFILTLPAIFGFFIGGYIYNMNPFVPWFTFGLFLLIGTLLMLKINRKNVIKTTRLKHTRE